MERNASLIIAKQESESAKDRASLPPIKLDKRNDSTKISLRMKEDSKIMEQNLS